MFNSIYSPASFITFLVISFFFLVAIGFHLMLTFSFNRRTIYCYSPPLTNLTTDPSTFSKIPRETDVVVVITVTMNSQVNRSCTFFTFPNLLPLLISLVIWTFSSSYADSSMTGVYPFRTCFQLFYSSPILDGLLLAPDCNRIPDRCVRWSSCCFNVEVFGSF